jgi:hypothetical protein
MKLPILGNSVVSKRFIENNFHILLCSDMWSKWEQEEAICLLVVRLAAMIW